MLIFARRKRSKVNDNTLEIYEIINVNGISRSIFSISKTNKNKKGVSGFLTTKFSVMFISRDFK